MNNKDIILVFFILVYSTYSYSNYRCQQRSKIRRDFLLQRNGLLNLEKYNVLNELKYSVIDRSGNVTTTMLKLIQMGDALKEKQDIMNLNFETLRKMKLITSGDNSESSTYEKVKGCMATVFIRTSLIPREAVVAVSGIQDKIFNLEEVSYGASSSAISIDGFADSRVAQGMLALLIEGFSDRFSAEEMLALDPIQLCKYFEFDLLLPPGRLNGFVNMIQLIQSQTRRALVPLVNNINLDAADMNIPSTTAKTLAVAHENADMDQRKGETAVLLSGGVDSSVALKLLKMKGEKVRAYYLKIWLEDEIAHLNECPWEEDLDYAQRVCEQLEVPLETLSLQREYWNQVVQYTLKEAEEGRTPNPDIMCNSRIKFGMFYEYIGRYHSKIATGHYAQTRSWKDKDGSTRTELIQSPDETKDQSYFLSALTQPQLQRCVFPIGHLQKAEVRRLANLYGLPTKDRKDSQGICFLGKLKFDDFIVHYLGTRPGPILCYHSGKELGEHRGLWFHTIGQRKGVGIYLHSGVHEGPWYVAAKDVSTNTLYVSNNLDAITQPRLSFIVGTVNWISGCEPAKLSSAPHRMDLQVKLRHGPTLVGAVVEREGLVSVSESVAAEQGREEADTGTGTAFSYRVTLRRKDKGIAPGQFAAFYSENIIDGGGGGGGSGDSGDVSGTTRICLGAGVISAAG